jgi:hypothetical protein
VHITAGSQMALAPEPAGWQITVLAAGTATQVPTSPTTLQ